MKPRTPRPFQSCPARRASLAICLGLIGTFVPPLVAAEVGAVAGAVSNVATANFLDGAMVELREVGRTAVTDARGRFRFEGIAPGSYTLVVTYTGLNEFQQRVQVAAGQESNVAVELRADIYQLAAYTVTGEREGNAASITRQRTAVNVRNVVAMDAYGNLPNDNVAEILMRMPGVTGFQSNDDTTSLISVRGLAPDLSTYSVDGVLQANANGFGRGLRSTGASAALFDEVEVVKALAAENSADSIGGQINVKTRSALSQKEKRRLTFRTQVRWVPEFFDSVPLRRPHPAHPLATLTYAELFDLFGGQRNLGITASLTYSQNVSAYWRAIQFYPTTHTDFPAPTNDYRTTNNLNYRFSSGATLKAEYQVSPALQVWASYLHSRLGEPWQRNFISQIVASTAAVDPAFTDDTTLIRRNTGNRITLNPQLTSYRQQDNNAGIGLRFRRDRLQLSADANLSASFAKVSPTPGDAGSWGGSLSYQVGDLGWEIDRRGNKYDPAFRWVDGRSPFDAVNFGTATQTQTFVKRWANNSVLNLDARYELPFALPALVKAGVRRRAQEIEEITRANTWTYRGATAFLAPFTTPSARTTFGERWGREFPWADPAEVGRHIATQPDQWTFNTYNYWQRYFQGTRDAGEEVTAGYLQGETQVGRLRLVAGARGERTEVETNGFVAARTLTTTAQRNADPVGSATRDYNNPVRTAGHYDDLFPSAHVTWRFTRNLQARLAWSNSIGRPPFADLLPAFSVNDASMILTVNNPALKPQHSENWDAALEYYFEPVGNFRVNWFRKTMTDFIVRSVIAGRVGTGPANGYNGEFANYELRTNLNAGTARVNGWEFDYWQQFSFLPGVFKGLGFQANFTLLATTGDYGGSVPLRSDRVQNFVPRSGSASLTYNYRGFNLRVGVNATGHYLHANSTVLASLFFREPRTVFNANLSYYLTRQLSVFCDLQNFTNEPQRWYRYRPERPGDLNVNTASINLGLSGRY